MFSLTVQHQSVEHKGYLYSYGFVGLPDVLSHGFTVCQHDMP